MTLNNWMMGTYQICLQGSLFCFFRIQRYHYVHLNFYVLIVFFFLGLNMFFVLINIPIFYFNPSKILEKLKQNVGKFIGTKNIFNI